jgi:GTP pyrophosphokinase
VGKGELERVAGEYGYSKMEDLHAALGYGRFSARQVLQKLASPEAPPQPPESAKPAHAAGHASGSARAGDLVLKVRGVDDLLVYRAKCCNPLPGDAIVGYITRGKGVAVHSTHCSNVQNLLYEVERMIDVEWERSQVESFGVKVLVHTDDRPGVLNQLTAVLASEQSNIKDLEASTDQARGDGAVIDMTVEVKDKNQLERIVAAMRRVSGVRDVERLM